MKRGGPNRNHGRNPISDTDQTVTVSLRLTTSQRAKLASLGGAAWVRKQISTRSEWTAVAHHLSTRLPLIDLPDRTIP